MITYESSALLEAAYTSNWSVSTAGVGTGVTATCNTCDDLNGATLRGITTITTAPWLGNYALDAMAPLRANGEPGGGNLNIALSADSAACFRELILARSSLWTQMVWWWTASALCLQIETPVFSAVPWPRASGP